MTIAVVGARGFVGGAVVAALRERGHEVVTVDLPRIRGDRSPWRDGVERWRRQQPDRWSALVADLRGSDAVVNAAGLAGPDETDEAALWAANVLLPAIVAGAASDARVPRFVHVSSAAVQGPSSLDETERTTPFSPYSRTKAEAEALLLAGGDGFPATVVVYRATSVMGPGRATTDRLRDRCSSRVPVLSDATPLPLAHIDNVGDAVAFLAVTPDPPRLAVHPSEGVTVADVVRWSGGRAIRLPRALAAVSAPTARRLVALAEGRRPGAAGAIRRIDLFLHGQVVTATALTARGWTPPRAKEPGHGALFATPDPPRRTRICFLITRSDTIGGAHVHVRDLATALLARGHEVHVLIGADGPYGDILRERGVPVVVIPSLVRELAPGADRRAYREVRAALADLAPDLLSTHSSKAGLIGRLAGRRAGVPTMFTAHGWAFTDGVPQPRRSLYALIELAAAPLAATIVCVSANDRRLAHRVGIDRLARTIHVPNAVRDVPPALRASPSSEPASIVMVARLDEPKRHDEVLWGLARLGDRRFRVDFVGDGPKQAELEQLAAELGLADRCAFLGRRGDVEQILAESQIFVLMSTFEGMPRSILEAMRAGLPVVASRTAGIPEVVVDGETGFLVDPHDVEGLASAVGAMLDDPELRRRMGTAGRIRFEERYELDRLVGEMLTVYADVGGRPAADGET